MARLQCQFALAFFASSAFGARKNARRATAALQSNAPQSPQVLNQATNVCQGRSSACEVELDVPQACVSGGGSTCPIVFFLHGAGGRNDNYARSSGVHDARMIGIYPQGDDGWNTGPKNGNDCSWQDFNCQTDPNEGDFIARIIAEVRSRGASGNVYAFGSSNGAALAHRIAANAGDELPIKGIVGAVTQLLASPARSGPGPLNYNQPQSNKPKVSVLTILGTADTLIPYNGGSSGVFGGDTAFQLMSALDSNEAWAAHNGCNLQPATSTVSASIGSGTATFYEYRNCQSGTFVEHYAVQGASHNAGGSTLGGQSASAVMYDFIRRCESGSTGPVPSPVPNPVPSPVPNPVPSPVPSPGPSPPNGCTDDPTWAGRNSPSHTCAFVAQGNPQGLAWRCTWVSASGVSASEACCATCS